jgi:2-keto-4-pentenoate hydratase/2-oxohepta-3-ene-1,7-dioic acid hydratase in catechol pathway
MMQDVARPQCGQEENHERIELPIAGRSETYTVRPSKIIALGKNYLDHIAEQAKVGIGGSFTDDVPAEPILFAITPNALIAEGEPIVLPAFLHECGFDRVRTHYEAELAFFIGKRCRRCTAEDALSHVLGYTCANDVSQRNIQGADKSGWFRGKSLDTFCPVGPCLVPAEDIPDPHSLRIRTLLNGRTVQDGNTGQMLFRIPDVLAFISKQITLEPGDLVLTGTPAGVGEISHGDTVEVEIEGIGTLRNPVIDERPAG